MIWDVILTISLLGILEIQLFFREGGGVEMVYLELLLPFSLLAVSAVAQAGGVVGGVIFR